LDFKAFPSFFPRGAFQIQNAKEDISRELLDPQPFDHPQGKMGSHPGGADGVVAGMRHGAGSLPDAGTRIMDGRGDGRGEVKKRPGLPADRWPVEKESRVRRTPLVMA